MIRGGEAEGRNLQENNRFLGVLLFLLILYWLDHRRGRGGRRLDAWGQLLIRGDFLFGKDSCRGRIQSLLRLLLSSGLF